MCDTEADAKHVCFELGVASQAVSLDGTIVKRSGEMTGGQGGIEGRAHRWEERHLDTLKNQREDCAKEVSVVQSWLKIISFVYLAIFSIYLKLGGDYTQ